MTHERHARYLQGPEDYDDLVGFRVDGAVECRCQRRASFVEAREGQRGRKRRPARGAHHRVVLPDLHASCVLYAGQGGRPKRIGAGLGLPDDPIRLDAGPVGILHLHQVQAPPSSASNGWTPMIIARLLRTTAIMPSRGIACGILPSQ